MNPREIETWLREDGEPGAALAWRGWCGRLEGPPTLAIAARDPALAARVATEAGISALTLAVEGEPGPGIQERLLGVHALLWATSATAALGAEEREILDRLAAMGAPAHRGVVVADVALIAQLCDDPVAEVAEVRGRVARIAPWPAVTDVAEWFSSAPAGQRLDELGRLVLGDEIRRADADVARADAEIRSLDASIAMEQSRVAEQLAGAARVAGHLRAGARRQVATVRADLGAFLVALEQALPAELDAVTDVEEIRRVLPHWLQHVVSRWLADRLAEADDALRQDLDGLVSREDLERLQLVLPAVHPGAVHGESDWTSRIGATLAIGGGAALLLFGLWAPGFAVVAGGMAWSSLGGAGRSAVSRGRLLETATGSLRALGIELRDALDAQLTAAETHLADAVAVAPSDVTDAQLQRRAGWIASRAAAHARGQRWRERAQ